MPLIPGGGGLSPGVIEQLSSGLVGFPQLPYAQSATVELSNERVQVLPFVEKITRHILIRNTTENPLTLFIGTQEIQMGKLSPGGHLWDVFNSGLPIEAIGSGTIEIFVRQDKLIDYQIGEIMAFPVEVGLRIGTGANFGFVTAAFQDAPSSIFDQNIQKYFNSNDGITGHKLAIIYAFTPGAAIDFTVQINGSRYDQSKAIQFQWINEIMALRLALAVGSDVMNPESNLLADGIGGLLTTGGYAGECPGTGGTLTLKPNFMNLRGRFVATNIDDGYYDTAIITNYIPNSNPLLGGTFVLEGF